MEVQRRGMGGPSGGPWGLGLLARGGEAPPEFGVSSCSLSPHL